MNSRSRTRAPDARRIPRLAALPWLALLAFASACSDAKPAPDAMIAVTSSFDQPIGATCDAVESLLCATGFGVCNNSVCAALCSSVEFPRCPSGTTEQHVTAGDRELCICTPR